MEDVRNFVKDNFMLLFFGVMLLCITSLGSLANARMEYQSISNNSQSTEFMEDSLY